MRKPETRRASLPASSGFTLMELLVVMVLVGLLSSLVFLATSSGIFSSKERRFVEEFRSALVRAKAASLGSGRIARLLIDGQERRFSVNGKGWHTIPDTIQIEANGLEEGENATYILRFFPDGSSSGGEIDVKWDTGRIDRFKISRILGLITNETLAR